MVAIAFACVTAPHRHTEILFLIKGVEKKLNDFFVRQVNLRFFFGSRESPSPRSPPLFLVLVYAHTLTIIISTLSRLGTNRNESEMTTTNPVNPLSPLLPSGPICSYGPRLAYTYFPSPAPAAEQLNAGTDHDRIHFFTVDDQLLYLSFFQDTGPLNAACL